MSDKVSEWLDRAEACLLRSLDHAKAGEQVLASEWHRMALEWRRMATDYMAMHRLRAAA